MSTLSNVPSKPGDILAIRISWALEALWLISAVSIPLIVAPPGSMFGYVEIPKITLLRTLTALMAMLWMVEWVVSVDKGWPRAPSWQRVRGWLRDDPTRWVALTLGLFVGVIILGTIASVSPSVSLWGKKPGADGYDLYTLLSYAGLFLIVYTHLKRPAQLWRLLAAIIATGVLVGLHSVLQHFDVDPILGEVVTSRGRTEGTIGNPIFAGAFLLTTVLLTLTIGTMYYLKYRFKWTLLIVAAALAIQLLGIIYTYSRGPWIGLAAGMALFLLLLWVVLDVRQAGRVALALLIALAVGLVVIFAERLPWPSQGQARSSEQITSAEAFASRAVSVYTEVVGGGVSGRTSTWKGSLQLIRDRPWFEFAEMPHPWIRHLLGYGPDVFRFVFPLRSPPRATAAIPYEAHNVPIHVAVDLGVLGFLSLVALAAAVLLVGFTRLLSRTARLPQTQLVLLAGLLAIFVGRGLEMVVGIPKASDLTIMTLLLAAFVSLPQVMASVKTPHSTANPTSSPSPEPQPRLSDWGWLIARASLALVAIVALGNLTWFRAINYARADGLAATAAARFEAGHAEQGVNLMRQATLLAPDMADYHLYLASMFEAISDGASSADLKLKTAVASYVENRLAVDANDLDAKSRAAAANAALTLGRLGQPGKLQESIKRYEVVVDMLPRFAVSHYGAALAYLIDNNPRPALQHIEVGDSLVAQSGGHNELTAEGLFLRGGVYRETGNVTAAVDAFESSLRLGPNGRYARVAHRHLAELYASLGDQAKSTQHAQAGQ